VTVVDDLHRPMTEGGSARSEPKTDARRQTPPPDARRCRMHRESALV
jgi:hypothetical protein